MKRIVTVAKVLTYEFNDNEYPINKYSDDEIMDIALERWDKCETEIFIDEDFIDEEEE